MGFEVFLNDYYEMLKLMHDNEAIVLDRRVIPLTQMEVAGRLNYSKMKVNSMFVILQKEGFIIQQTRGKYILTDKAVTIINAVDNINKKLC